MVEKLDILIPVTLPMSHAEDMYECDSIHNILVCTVQQFSWLRRIFYCLVLLPSLKAQKPCEPKNHVTQICSIRLYMVDKYIPNKIFAMMKFVNQPMYSCVQQPLLNKYVHQDQPMLIYKGLPSWFCQETAELVLYSTIKCLNSKDYLNQYNYHIYARS